MPNPGRSMKLNNPDASKECIWVEGVCSVCGMTRKDHLAIKRRKKLHDATRLTANSSQGVAPGTRRSNQKRIR